MPNATATREPGTTGAKPQKNDFYHRVQALYGDGTLVAETYHAFDRLTDIDTSLQSNQDMGGAAVNVDWKIGRGRLNSSTSWRARSARALHRQV